MESGNMSDKVASHYAGYANLASRIADRLRKAGKDIGNLRTEDLATVDEFHIRGFKATLELAQSLDLTASDHLLDIGSGLGGPARTVAETHGCRVTGIDLTQPFCDAGRIAAWIAAEQAGCAAADAVTQGRRGLRNRFLRQRWHHP
jgi:SAM-dependent methyltransferase